jgi:hypothetical protein
MKFVAEDDSLTILLQGSEILLSLKRKLVLPWEKIVDLTWTPEFNYRDLMVRIGGTGVPRLLYAGHFRDLDTKETLFLYLRRPKGIPELRSVSDANVLAITMRDYPYAKVLVTCQPDIGASLMNWFENGRQQSSA